MKIQACLLRLAWRTIFGKLSTAYGLVGIVRLEGKLIRFGLPPQK
jgi:hypothetical protein